MVLPTNSDVASILLAFLDSIRSDMQALLLETCSFMHVKALDIIARAREPSMKEVADDLKITSPGATMVVDKLVENGEIERVSDPDDRRIVRLKITARGRSTLKTGMKVIRQRIGERMRSLTREELDHLTELLKKLI